MEETYDPDDKYLTLDFKQCLSELNKHSEKEDKFR